MHFYFRTDGNKIIATGHVMRCLSIADAIKEMGHEVTFITADDQCSGLLHQRGYEFINLFGKWNDLEYELCELENLVKTCAIPVLIIDSYYVTERYLRILTSLTQTVYIDDLNAFHYPVDVLINYAIYADKFMYQVQYPDTRLLLGCNYAPLRSQFKNVGMKEIRKQVQSILITTGGTDNQNMIGTLLDKMTSATDFEHISIHVVTGIFNSNLEKLHVIEKQNDSVTIHCNVVNMAELMKEADVAISAGGSTLYELCACGVPTITYSFADNQLGNVHGFAEKGLMDYAGDTRESVANCIEGIYVKLKELIDDEKKRENYSYRLQQLVDGRGSQKISIELQYIKFNV